MTSWCKTGASQDRGESAVYQYAEVEEGYPKYMTSLKQEPRFKNLSVALDDGIDAAFADQR
ncbi:MAG: hypothetical protein F6K28_07270, partial [Microcoleus sp. SIO2G3]|nr:hypothetical protein [Microcoleus sp. SIO2G3]